MQTVGVCATPTSFVNGTPMRAVHSRVLAEQVQEAVISARR